MSHAPCRSTEFQRKLSHASNMGIYCLSTLLDSSFLCLVVSGSQEEAGSCSDWSPNVRLLEGLIEVLIFLPLTPQHRSQQYDIIQPPHNWV